jgi:hypothetical protein
MKLGEEIQLSVFAPSKERIKDYIEVPVPLSRGMLGLRVCLINAEDKALFKAVRNLSDFKKFGIKFIVGSEWTDREIFLYNGLDIIEAQKYEDLFRLTLVNKKVCFSRSLNEITNETSMAKAFDLSVEDQILFQYDLPMYVYVTKSRPELAKRIEEGLRIHISEFSYFQHFWNRFADVFQLFKVKKRKLIKLEMPHKYVSEKVLENPLMWLPTRMKK